MRGETDWEFGTDMYTVLYLKQTTNKDLLYSTGNSAQYPGINHNGKEYKKRTYICVTESHCCTAEMNTTW